MLKYSNARNEKKEYLSFNNTFFVDFGKSIPAIPGTGGCQ
jgi:hypothetical protein